MYVVGFLVFSSLSAVYPCHVDELRFADGRVWRQDLTREALFWDN